MANEAASNERVTGLAVAFADALNQRGMPINGATGEVLVKQGPGNFDVAWQPFAAGGDVVGPASSVNNAMVQFDGTTGKLIKGASFTQYGIMYGGGTGALGVTAVGSSGQVLTSNGAGVAPTFQTPAAGGDVVGPASAANNGIALFDGTTGKLLKSSAAVGTLAYINGGTGVATALAINIGSAGAPVLFNGAGGTPSSLTLTSAAGLPVSTGLTGAGTGVITALGVNIGTAGAFVVNGGALGTPSSGTATNLTGLPIGGLTGLGTGVGTALAINVGSAGAFVTFNGALGTPSSGTASSMTVDGTDAVGFRNIPVNSQSTAYTTVLADGGKTILHPTADNNARTFTIAANASVAYPVGTAITFVNQINTATIAINSDTLTLAGAGTTGSRTLAASGVATAVKVTSTIWFISGAGLT